MGYAVVWGSIALLGAVIQFQLAEGLELANGPLHRRVDRLDVDLHDLAPPPAAGVRERYVERKALASGHRRPFGSTGCRSRLRHLGILVGLGRLRHLGGIVGPGFVFILLAAIFMLLFLVSSVFSGAKSQAKKKEAEKQARAAARTKGKK